jgi:16S rRNA (guanine966-N2)-methyltransferase
VVDLFAGSGALGIEALSRGAAEVTFVERSREASRVLEANLVALDVVGRSRVLSTGVRAFLEGLARPAPEERPPFDVALADPPYASAWPARLAASLAERRFADLLCVEHAPDALGEEGVVWRRVYGDTILSFLRPPGEPVEAGHRPEPEPPHGRRS